MKKEIPFLKIGKKKSYVTFTDFSRDFDSSHTDDFDLMTSTATTSYETPEEDNFYISGLDSHLANSGCDDISSIIERSADIFSAENDFALTPEQEDFFFAQNGLPLEPETGEEEELLLAEDDIMFDLEEPITMANSKAKEKKKNPPKPRKPRLVPTYELDPRTGKYTELKDAYAQDGTPIRPKNCPDGKKRSCCRYDAEGGPFSECWKDGHNNAVCRYARNQFCCEDVPVKGGPGVNCEEAKWVKARGRVTRPEDSSAMNQFREFFPILQDLSPVLSDPDPEEDLNRSPAYCSVNQRD